MPARTQSREASTTLCLFVGDRLVHTAPIASPIRAKKVPETAPAWSTDDVLALYELPFMDLIHRAQSVHREHFQANAIQLSSLLSIKTGGCPENCAYCPQSAHYDTGVQAEKLMDLEAVLDAARQAQAAGAQRFCIAAAWRSPKPHQLDAVAEMIKGVKALGMETCVTLGMLKTGQAEQLKRAGLDYYNHNLDTSAAYYTEIISSRRYQDRLDTLEQVQKADLHVCCGGIVGMGESRLERAAFIAQLASLRPYPQSVPINNLVAVKGTPLAQTSALDPLEFIRTIAVARITMPRAVVRLSAGRNTMSDSEQALCFLAGANSMFYGETLLTTTNPQHLADQALLQRLGIEATANPTREAAPCP